MTDVSRPKRFFYRVMIFLGIAIVLAGLAAYWVLQYDSQNPVCALVRGCFSTMPVTAISESFDIKKKLEESEREQYKHTAKESNLSIHNIRLTDIRFIHYEEHGAPGEFSEDFYLDVESSTIYYLYAAAGRRYREDEASWRMASQRLSQQACTQFNNILKQIDFSQWRNRYCADGICDGTFWNLHICMKNGDDLRVYGSNAWPSSPLWKAFLSLFAEVRKSVRL